MKTINEYLINKQTKSKIPEPYDVGSYCLLIVKAEGVGDNKDQYVDIDIVKITDKNNKDITVYCNLYEKNIEFKWRKDFQKNMYKAGFNCPYTERNVDFEYKKIYYLFEKEDGLKLLDSLVKSKTFDEIELTYSDGEIYGLIDELKYR